MIIELFKAKLDVAHYDQVIYMLEFTAKKLRSVGLHPSMPTKAHPIIDESSSSVATTI